MGRRRAREEGSEAEAASAEKEFASLYAERFSATELNEIAMFYRSGVGA